MFIITPLHYTTLIRYLNKPIGHSFHLSVLEEFGLCIKRDDFFLPLHVNMSISMEIQTNFKLKEQIDFSSIAHWHLGKGCDL